MTKVYFEDLGLKDYKESWDYQEQLFKQTVDLKIANRKADPEDRIETTSRFLLVEHPHVFTLGKSGEQSNLLINENMLKARNATFYKINRGGDITYHGPGQIVGYPLLDLDHFFTDIHRYMRCLEEVIIRTLSHYGVHGERFEGLTGVWLDKDSPAKARKIAALGVKSSRWVTMHGFAFNINTDLDYFNHIIPCGIIDKQVTSLKKELGREVPLEEVKEVLKNHFQDVFECELVNGVQ